MSELKTICEISPKYIATWEVHERILEQFQFYKTYINPKMSFLNFDKILKEHLFKDEYKYNVKFLGVKKNKGEDTGIKGMEFDRVIIDEFVMDIEEK